MNSYTDQKKVDSGEHFCYHHRGVSVKIHNEHRYNTDMYNLKYKLTKTKRQLVVHRDDSSIASCQTKIPVTF